MEAIGRLAGAIAHDFNNMLTVILGFGGELAESLEPSDPRREQALEICRAGERAANLTRQLLAFSRRHILHPRVIDLTSVVVGLSEMLRRLIGVNIELVMIPATDLHPIKVQFQARSSRSS